jgi:hypothetical protein
MAMRKTLLAVLMGFTSTCFAQISIGTAEALSIPASHSISFDGLMLMPHNSLTFSDITFTKSTTAVSVGSGSSISHVYNVSKSFAFTGLVTFHYKDAELNGNQESSLQLVLKDANNWVVQPNPGLRDVINNYMEHSMGGTIEGATLSENFQVLPLVANSLTAKWINNHVQIQWSVFQNEQYQSFTVESSTNRQAWKPVQTILATTTHDLETYSVLDFETDFDSKEYRIALQLRSGIRQYSSLVPITKNRSQGLSVLKKNGGAEFYFSNTPDQLFVINRAGQKIWQSIERKNTYSVSNLSPGVYYLYFSKNGSWQTRSFIATD